MNLYLGQDKVEESVSFVCAHVCVLCLRTRVCCVCAHLCVVFAHTCVCVNVCLREREGEVCVISFSQWLKAALNVKPCSPPCTLALCRTLPMFSAPLPLHFTFFFLPRPYM